MLALSLIWLALGLALGVVAVAARLTPARWLPWRWLATPALGAVATLVGGWLGALLFDRIFASLVALCFGVVSLAVAGLLARWRGAAHSPRPLREGSGEGVPAALHSHDTP